MNNVRAISIENPESDQAYIVGQIMPSFEYDPKLGAYHARAFLIEDGTNKIAAGWEFEKPLRTKRQAKRIALKIARRMAGKLNRRAMEFKSEEES